MKTIVLDQGHGGTTPGKRSFDGRLREYEFNRAVAKRMKLLLEKAGYKVILTCVDDKDITLNERCKIANSINADIFVSIHANAAGTTWNDANGWEILICEKGGNSEKLAKCIEKESKILGLKNRGIKVDEHLYVLNNTRMPSVLIEHGFFTNKEECAKLLSGEFRQKCAAANTLGIIEYFKSKEK